MGADKADSNSQGGDPPSLSDESIRELWEERAAVREFDGGLTTERAEYMAVRDVRGMISPQSLPEWLIEKVTNK